MGMGCWAEGRSWTKDGGTTAAAGSIITTITTLRQGSSHSFFKAELATRVVSTIHACVCSFGVVRRSQVVFCVCVRACVSARAFKRFKGWWGRGGEGS